MSLFSKLAGAAVAAFIATSASAAVLTVDTITSAWQNTVGGGGTVNTTNGDPTSSLRWGTGGSQSGYDFTRNAVPLNMSEGAAVSLGMFNHLNFPIDAGTAITATELALSFTIAPGTTVNTVFGFTHNETTNYPGSGVCVEGGSTPCPDLVTVALNLGASDVFDIGGVTYIFNVLGFSTDGGQTIKTSFLTNEDAQNPAELYATFQTRASIPLPAAGWLLIAGLGGLAAAGRRKKSA